MRKKSFPFNRYPNVFERLGYSPAAIEARTQEIFMTLFYGDENQRLYHIVGPELNALKIREITMSARRA